MQRDPETELQRRKFLLVAMAAVILIAGLGFYINPDRGTRIAYIVVADASAVALLIAMTRKRMPRAASALTPESLGVMQPQTSRPWQFPPPGGDKRSEAGEVSNQTRQTGQYPPLAETEVLDSVETAERLAKIVRDHNGDADLVMRVHGATLRLGKGKPAIEPLPELPILPEPAKEEEGSLGPMIPVEQ